MAQHEIIETLSPIWWMATLTSAVIIFMTLIIAKRAGTRTRMEMRKWLGIVFLSTAILIQPYLIYIGKWSLQQSLPLQLCSISGWLSGIVMLFPSQFGFECLLYWGVPGAFHSILTPEFTNGKEGLLFYEYYISHGGILLASLYLFYITGMRLRKGSWIRIFWITQLYIPIVGLINWTIGSNYMYLAHRPIANNPFFIGPWPWYIVILEFAALLHFFIIYKLFKLKSDSIQAINVGY